MSGPRANRRQVLTGTGAALASSVLPRAAMASTSSTVILQTRHHVLPAAVRRQLGANGAQVLMLEDDPVRMWRGQWAALLGQRKTRLLGMTRWPEFLLIRGLAAESRRHVRYQRVDVATGAIVWLIA